MKSFKKLPNNKYLKTKKLKTLNIYLSSMGNVGSERDEIRKDKIVENMPSTRTDHIYHTLGSLCVHNI